jgi:hypothetical protein
MNSLGLIRSLRSVRKGAVRTALVGTGPAEPDLERTRPGEGTR